MKQITMDYEIYIDELDRAKEDGYAEAISDIKENILKYDEPNKWSPEGGNLTSILHLLYLKAIVAVKKDQYDQCKADLHVGGFHEKAS